MENRKCHNCKGTGKVPTDKHLVKNPKLEISGVCYYCSGKGHRTNYYGKD